MASYERIIGPILDYEAGYDPKGGAHHDKSDDGGPTQWGLASRFHPDLAAEIAAGTLTRQKAIAHYKAEYWDPMRLDDDMIPDAIAFILFDSRIHGSGATAVRALQLFLPWDRGTVVAPDGVWGPKTRAGVTGEWPRSSIKSFVVAYVVSAMIELPSYVKHELEEQRQRGLPPSDYTSGWGNRIHWRAKQAMALS